VSVLGDIGLRLLLQKVPAALWVTDADLRLTASLGAGLAAVGWKPGQVGIDVRELLGRYDEAFPPVAAHLAALAGEGRALVQEWNGRIIDLQVEPLRDPAGALVGVLGLAVDITDQRVAGAAIEARPVAVAPAGRVPRALIHDLADALTAVLAGAERLLVGGAAKGVVHEEVEQVVRAASQGVDLVRQLRDAARGSASAEANVAELGGGETILLVDDEPQVRGFVRRALEEYGYRVLETSAVDDALEIGASYPGRIHLLLTDVVLPDMSGPQLAARLAPLRPEMRILYMTGYADDAIVHRGVLAAGQALLVKPFTSIGLAHEVRKALRS
jgi:CheY-like chemotaxis protein